MVFSNANVPYFGVVCPDPHKSIAHMQLCVCVYIHTKLHFVPVASIFYIYVYKIEGGLLCLLSLPRGEFWALSHLLPGACLAPTCQGLSWVSIPGLGPFSVDYAISTWPCESGRSK